MEMFQSNIHYYFTGIKWYIVSIEEIYGVLSLSMAQLGAKYAEVRCKVYGYFWVHVYAFWVHVYGSVGCMYAVVVCMPDCV